MTHQLIASPYPDGHLIVSPGREGGIRDCNFKGVTSGTEETSDDERDHGRDWAGGRPVGG